MDVPDDLARRTGLNNQSSIQAAMSIVKNLSTGALAYRNEVRDLRLWHETVMPAL